jgi:hypothetical protein
MRRPDPVQEIAELLQVAQTAATCGWNPERRGLSGKVQLGDPDHANTPFDTVITYIPMNYWPQIGENGCFDIDCDKDRIDDKDHEQRIRKVKKNQKYTKGECAMINGLAKLMNVYIFTAEGTGFYDHYALEDSRWHKSWAGYVTNRHPAGLLSMRTTRFEWGPVIYHAYLGQKEPTPARAIAHLYPPSLQTGVVEEQERILAQSFHPDPDATDFSAREHEILENLESSHHDATPNWLNTIQERKNALLRVIKSRDKHEIALACREHIRTISDMWDLLTDEAKAACEQWNDVKI